MPLSKQARRASLQHKLSQQQIAKQQLKETKQHQKSQKQLEKEQQESSTDYVAADSIIPPSNANTNTSASSLPDLLHDASIDPSSPNATASAPQTPLETEATTTSSSDTPQHQSISGLLHEFVQECRSLATEMMEYAKYKCWKKKVLTAVVSIASILVFWDLLFGGYIVHYLHKFVVWMTKHSIEAVFAFIGIFVISTCE